MTINDSIPRIIKPMYKVCEVSVDGEYSEQYFDDYDAAYEAFDK